LLSWDVGSGTYLRRWNQIQVRYPKSPSPEQLRWLDDWFTGFDQTLKGRKFSDPLEGYAAHIVVDAWVDYILFEELIFNLDGYVRSFYMHKDRNAKLRPGPVWDHDLALGHQFPHGTSFEEWWYVRRAAPHGWIKRLVADPNFIGRMAERWRVFRRGPLSDSALETRIDEFARPLLSGAAARNFSRWPILAVERPFPKPNDYITIASETYAEQITALKRFVRQRAAWMDAHLKPGE
jgi:hypothetical protein